ncbi:hypothetical protein HY024_05280 [Candidatus Curtissbacteria bacterium]|nr:hypothetical protein [Candidatus Curtissbacteria bacterium]
MRFTKALMRLLGPLLFLTTPIVAASKTSTIYTAALQKIGPKKLKFILIPLFATVLVFAFAVTVTFAAPKISTPFTRPTPTPAPTPTITPTPSPITISWHGNGTTNGLCSSIGNFDDLNPQPGQQGWLFILTSPIATGPYLLTTTFNPSTQTPNNPITGVKKANGSVHFVVYTTIGATLVSASATFGTANSILTVSHCEKGVQPLQVSKTANTSFTRTWTWHIDKSADKTDLGTLQPTDVGTVNYTVGVSATSQDSNHVVSGNITITNPSGNPTANITNVVDSLNASGAVTVNCPGGLSQSLVAGSTLTCTYSASVGNTSDSQNTVTVSTSGSVSGGSANANVDWNNATISKVDDCITVNDTNPKGPQNVQVCAPDAPKTFNYSTTFSKNGVADVKLTCGNNTYKNTASFVTDDNNLTGSADWTVTANVQCNTFWCSPGYWGSAAKFDIYAYINAHKVVTPPPTIAGTDLYSSITGISPAALKSGSPPNPTLAAVLGSPSTYGGPAFNSVADYFAYLLGWGGNQNTGENCPLNANGN